MQIGISAMLAKEIFTYLFGLSHCPSDSFRRGPGHDGYPVLRVTAHTPTQLLPAAAAGMAWGSEPDHSVLSKCRLWPAPYCLTARFWLLA